MFLYLSLLETEEQKNRFIEIYDRNRDRMYNIVYDLLKQKEESENVVHDAFVRLANHFERYERLTDKEMNGMCITIAKNTALRQRYKQRKIFSAGLEEIEEMEWKNDEENRSFPEDMMIKKEQEEMIQQLLDKLPAIYHDILVLRYYCNLSVKETAQFLEIPKSTAEMRLHRAKERMRKALEEKGVQYDGAG